MGVRLPNIAVTHLGESCCLIHSFVETSANIDLVR